MESPSSAPSSDRLATRIMWGLAIGVVIGLIIRGLITLFPALDDEAQWLVVQVFDPFGQIFLRMLFFVVVPLVFASLTHGIVQLGRLDRLGPLAGKTFTIFFINMAVGVALGLLYMNIAQPGDAIDPIMREQLLAENQAGANTLQQISEQQRERGFTFATAVEMFMPRNLLLAVTNFEMLPLIIFALLVGAAGTTLAPERAARLQDALEVVTALMTRIVGWALRLAPYAVAALLSSVVVKFGVQFLQALAFFAIGLLLVMALHLFGTMTVLLKLLTKRSPRDFYRAVRIILVTAFSTSSSAATLPTSLAVTKRELGVSSSTAGFVLPLGATMNMSGTALYEGCVVLFIAQVYGVDLGLAEQLTLLILAVLSAVAVAGIPGGSLPLIVGLLVNFGVPPEGIALVLGIDRILDMARTALNVGADVVTSCIVDEQVARQQLRATPAGG